MNWIMKNWWLLALGGIGYYMYSKHTKQQEAITASVAAGTTPQSGPQKGLTTPTTQDPMQGLGGYSYYG